MRLIKALVAMVAGLVVLVLAAAFLLPTERIANIAAREFEGATGRSLHFGGEVVPSFYPVIGATARDVRVGNPLWAGDGPMLTAAEMDIGLNFMALLRGDIVVERVVLQSPDLHLRRDAQGQINWNFAESASPRSAVGAPSDAPPRRLSLAEARVVDGALRFEDIQSGTDLRITGLEAVLRLPEFDGPATLTAAGRSNGQPFEIAFQTPDAARLLSGAVTPVGLDGTLAGAEVVFGGRVGLDDMALEGQLDARIPALRPLLQLVGQAGADVAPDFLPLGLRGQVTRAADGRIFAREAQFQAGAVRLAGALDIVPGAERPRVTGQLSGDVIDLRRQSGAGREQPGRGPSGQGAQGWSRDVIDASALGQIDADIALTLAGLRMDGLTLGRTRLGLAIDRARAVFDLREVALFGGQVTGEFVMNNRSGLSVGGDLRLREIDLLSLLTEMADYRRLQGQANLDLQFLGVGNTLYDIMHSLRGSGSLAFSEGEIIGFDLAGMLRNLDMSYMGEGNRTAYQAVNGTFTMSDGILRNEDLRLEASRFSMSGRGAVGIGARNLDYRIVPAALRGDDTLRVPLMITGPWDAPRFRLDMEALAREQLRVEQERLEDIARTEARRLEDRARTEAEARLERELGIRREEGERVEDTLRRGVEQELGRRLRGLLGAD